MASNELPNKLDELFTLAEDMADGLQVHEGPVGVLQNLEVRVRADLAGAESGQQEFGNARAAKRNATAAQRIADSNGKAFIGNSRAVLAPFLGESWSEAWAPTGFPDQSTAVPSTMAVRQALLNALRGFFVANPARENAPLNVTATEAAARFTALSTARSAAHAAVTTVNDRKKDRAAAVKVLRKRMRGLIEELTQLLAGDDARWYAFGLVPPDGEDAPDEPTNLVASPLPDEPGTWLLDWDDAARAASYRVYVQVVGTDPDFRLAVTVSDSDATLTDLPTSGTLRFRVIAVNAAGNPSPPSETLEVVIAPPPPSP